MRHVLICCTAFLPLIACSGGEEKGKQMSAEQVAEEMSKMKMEPGQWEATNEILSATAPGIPPDALRKMVGQKQTASNCLTPEQAAKPSANFLAGQKNSQCTYKDFSLDDGKMTGEISCTGAQMPGTMVMQMDGEYGARNYSMNMEMKTAGLPNGMDMIIKAKTTARRVGDCA
jgi:hypothetical protein